MLSLVPRCFKLEAGANQKCVHSSNESFKIETEFAVHLILKGSNACERQAEQKRRNEFTKESERKLPRTEEEWKAQKLYRY